MDDDIVGLELGGTFSCSFVSSLPNSEGTDEMVDGELTSRRKLKMEIKRMKKMRKKNLRGRGRRR